MERVTIKRYSDLFNVVLSYNGVTVYNDYILANDNAAAIGRALSIAAGHNFRKPALYFNV